MNKLIGLYDFIRHLYINAGTVVIRDWHDDELFSGKVEDCLEVFESEYGSSAYFEVYAIEAPDTDGSILVKVYDRRETDAA